MSTAPLLNLQAKREYKRGMPLTKSLFIAGCQCPKLLWWKVHEPFAVELQPDKVLLDLFDQGRQVTELARARFPAGTLVAESGMSRSARLSGTKEALHSDTPAVQATHAASWPKQRS